MYARECSFCHNEIPKHKDKRQKFCSRSCAASYNNAKRIRIHKYECIECGKRLTNNKTKKCQDCHVHAMEADARARPISEFFVDGASRAKFNHIRKWARLLMERSNRAKECKICGFDIVVEVCHLRPINDFPEDTPMGVVNSLDNLIYLCPNHHAMLDRDLLKDLAPVVYVG